jgi:hypothetical protein
MKMRGSLDFTGRRMRVRATDAVGVVSDETVLVFEQAGQVVSARYRGGSIVDGYLIGLLQENILSFRYVQADKSGRLHAGVSTGTIEILADGRLRLIEEFEWITRSGKGTNVFEEIG